jgi:hypothetical protein
MVAAHHIATLAASQTSEHLTIGKFGQILTTESSDDLRVQRSTQWNLEKA